MDPSQHNAVWSAGAMYEPYVGRWSRLVARELLKWLSIPVQKDWLDVGCGSGALSQITARRGSDTKFSTSPETTTSKLLAPKASLRASALSTFTP